MWKFNITLNTSYLSYMEAHPEEVWLDPPTHGSTNLIRSLERFQEYRDNSGLNYDVVVVVPSDLILKYALTSLRWKGDAVCSFWSSWLPCFKFHFLWRELEDEGNVDPSRTLVSDVLYAFPGRDLRSFMETLQGLARRSSEVNLHHLYSKLAPVLGTSHLAFLYDGSCYSDTFHSSNPLYERLTDRANPNSEPIKECWNTPLKRFLGAPYFSRPDVKSNPITGEI
ncbi:hypothetical protein CYMTET_53179 [Cymbomonas tetramitiformis]|uniref:Uncharacterized protein n=1 Tax=Cymbomonas tetramitiformis TaxID=36881 RepID=A0AAE0ERZ7_9CHLO|nr:hypothetical protein CYMTET_53179 [Cymbomonas tetramitiformis]